mmetsp:Transcript_93608/g.291759  ORF Transcript_93608/g.291759 Transcript_93608/m.291759 type:complete len:214 (+) Transcript_93608:77-718(+)
MPGPQCLWSLPAGASAVTKTELSHSRSWPDNMMRWATGSTLSMMRPWMTSPTRRSLNTPGSTAFLDIFPYLCAPMSTKMYLWSMATTEPSSSSPGTRSLNARRCEDEAGTPADDGMLSLSYVSRGTVAPVLRALCFAGTTEGSEASGASTPPPRRAPRAFALALPCTGWACCVLCLKVGAEDAIEEFVGAARAGAGVPLRPAPEACCTEPLEL